MKSSLLNKLNQFFSTQPVEKAWLFGSYARGDENEESDLDIMVTYKADFRPGLFGICRLIEQIEKLTGLKVDLVERGTLYPSIAKEVELQKIPIYERIPSRPSEARAHA